jgi:hypothetical protein
MAPDGIELSLLQRPEDPVIQGAPEARLLGVIDPARQEMIRVAFEQRNVPVHLDAEAFVHVTANRAVAREEHFQLDSGFSGNPSEQWRLVLDGMADEVG